MTQDETLPLEDTPELTTRWETMGLEDRPVEMARTVTMHDRFDWSTDAPESIVSRLPALVEPGTETLPELQKKGELGKGGMGLVELAEQLPLGREVAVKTVRENKRSDRARMVLLREGWTTGVLEHPNVVPIYTLGRDEDGEPVIVMKKISGTSWLELIDDPEAAPEAFDVDDPLELHVEILSRICNAVDYAHDCGIIHRDLKPENVMVGEFGEVYLLDWGIAVSIDDEPSSRLTSIADVDQPAGTPAYMAPEMTDGEGELLGPHTDVFLLGAMLHEALTGRPPYGGETVFQIMLKAHRCQPPEFDESVPPELAAICRRAMARDPDDRYPSVRAFRRALVDFRTHRRSRQLATSADQRMETVDELLQNERNGEEVDERDLYKVFGECRFAYEQALEINPDNREATRGLQQVLEAMADRALRRDAHKAASLLIADFPESNESFQKRLDELEEQLEERREDYEQLQRIRRRHDAEVGRAGRAAFMVVAGAIWVGMASVIAVIVGGGMVEVTHRAAFVHIVVFTLVMAGLIFAGRRYFIANEFNRKILTCVIVAFCGSIAHRGMAWIAEAPLEQTLMQEWLMYGIGGALLGVAFDRRIFALSVPFVVAAVVGTAFPALVWWILPPANAIAVGAMIALWWPKKSDSKLARKGG